MTTVLHSSESCFRSWDSFSYCYPTLSKSSSYFLYGTCSAFGFINNLLPFAHKISSDIYNLPRLHTFEGNLNSIINQASLKLIENYVCRGYSVFGYKNIASIAYTTTVSAFGALNLVSHRIKRMENMHHFFSNSILKDFYNKEGDEGIKKVFSFIEFTTLPAQLTVLYHTIFSNFKEQNKLYNSFSSSTLLHFASTSNQISLIEKMLNNGYRINQKDKYGNTPLHAAALAGAIEAALLLLKKNADAYSKNEQGYDYIDCAVQNSQIYFIDTLLKKVPSIRKERALITAIKEKKYDVISFLLKKKSIDIHKKIPEIKMSPYEYGVVTGDLKIIKLIEASKS